jgi:hypothetical protein
MMNRKGTILCAVVLGVLLLAAAGCGGGKTAATPGPATRVGTSGTFGATGVTGNAGPSSGSNGPTGTNTTASGLGALASASNCLQLAHLGSALSAAFTGSNANVQKQAALIQQFADHTPSDIRADFETLAGAYAKIANALKGVNLSSGQRPSAAVIARLTSLSTQINQASLSKASQHIATWAAQNCHA